MATSTAPAPESQVGFNIYLNPPIKTLTFEEIVLNDWPYVQRLMDISVLQNPRFARFLSNMSPCISFVRPSSGALFQAVPATSQVSSSQSHAPITQIHSHPEVNFQDLASEPSLGSQTPEHDMYSPRRTPVLRVSHRSIAALRDIKYQVKTFLYAKANNQRLIFQFEWDTGLTASLSWVWGSKRPCRIIDYNASDGMFKLLPLRENDARTDRFIYPWDGRMGDATSFQSQMSDTGPRCLPPRTLDFKQTYVASPVCGVKKHVDFSIRTTREDFPLPRVEVGLAVAASAGWVDNHGIDGVFGLSPLMIDGDPDIKGTWLQHVVGFGEDQPMFWFSLQNGVERLHFGDYNFDRMQSVTNMQRIPLLHEQSDDQFWTCRLLKIGVRRRDQGRTENNTRIFSTNLDINGDPRSKRDVNLPGYRCLFDTGASMSYIRKDDMDWIRERALAEGVRTWGGVTEQDGVENRDPIFIDTVQASARALCLELFFVDSLVEETEVIVGPIMFEDFTMGPEVHPDEASTAKLFRIQYFDVGCGVPDFPENSFHDVLLGLSFMSEYIMFFDGTRRFIGLGDYGSIPGGF